MPGPGAASPRRPPPSSGARGSGNIAGATGASYTPVAADDRTALSCRVTASNAAGSLSATTTSLPVAYAAPVAGTLPDLVLTLGDAGSVPAAAAFTGSGLSYAVSGAGATIDAATGVLGIPTAALLAATTVTVTATNSGGSASVSFQVSVKSSAIFSPGFIPRSKFNVVETSSGSTIGTRRMNVGTYAGGSAVTIPSGWELKRYSTNTPGGSVNAASTAIDSGGSEQIDLGTLAVGTVRYHGLVWWHTASGTAFYATDQADLETIGGTNYPYGTVVIRGVAPTVATAPVLSGTGKIGSAVSVSPGAWNGTPAPTLALQWRRDGAGIAGATGASYTPVAADDRTALSCRVTASNTAGSLSATTTSLSVAYAAPVAGTLPDLVLTLGDAGSVAAAAAFTGSGLGYAVSGAGATIDAATGVLGIPTAALLAATTVTVTATNSGGSASVSFKVSVNAGKPTGGISTDAELMAALNNAKAGGTITLAAGAVFKEFVWPKNFAGDPNNPLTIASASRSNQAIFRGIGLCQTNLKGNLAHLSNAPAASSVKGVVFEWVTFYAERFSSCKDANGVNHSLIQARRRWDRMAHLWHQPSVGAICRVQRRSRYDWSEYR